MKHIKLFEQFLLNEKISYDEFESMIKPFFDLVKSKKWVWNSSGDSFITLLSPVIALYHKDTLPTTKEGEYKGEPKPLEKDPVASRQINYKDELENKNADVIMNPDGYVGYETIHFYSKSKSILEEIKHVMTSSDSSYKLLDPIEEKSTTFISSKDFEPQKYFIFSITTKEK